MATYYPSPRLRHSWLLTNGEVVTEPELEETERKYRIVGTRLSAFKNSMDQLLYSGIEELAKQHDAAPWMRVRDAVLPPIKTLHLIDPNASSYAETRYEWRFKHKTLPINAVIMVKLRGGPVTSPTQTLTVELNYPSTSPEDSQAQRFLTNTAPGFHRQLDSLTDRNQRDMWTQFIQAHVDARAPETGWQSVLRSQNFPVARMAAKAMIEAIREVDALEAIYIPDLRHVPDYSNASAGWLRLEAFETNTTPQVTETLVQYLESAPTIEEAAQHYEQMLKALRRAGMVLQARSANDFLTALLTGSKDALTISLGSGIVFEPGTDGQDHPITDSSHILSLHLPSGTFSVTCSHPQRNEIAAKWDESITMASLTGKQDELLAYARRYVEQQGEARSTSLTELGSV